MTVLVISADDDPTTDAVITQLRKRSVPVARLDIGDFPTSLSVRAAFDGERWRTELGSKGGPVDLSAVRSIYYRRPTRFSFPEDLSAADRVFAAEEARLGIGGVLAAHDRPWVNHPAKIAEAEYKPRQLAVAAACGLRVPPTLVTNDHNAVREFADRHGQLVCKTLSPIAHCQDGQVRITFTTVVDPADIDPESLAVTAHLFQQWVPKDHEVRVTVVGAQPIAAAIEARSSAASVDWRSDYDALIYSATTVPDIVRVGMAEYLRTFGLSYGAFDFVVTPDGDWVFLECNPAGQWLWIEDRTDLPIAAAFAELLAGGQR